MRLPKFCRRTNPRRTNDKKNLGQNEVDESERFLE
jgi:hypothetical protein